MFHVKHYLEKPNDPHVYRGVRLLTGDGMAYFKLLIAVVLSLFALVAHAGYAQVSPPSGWTPPASGSTGGFFTHASAANDVKYLQATVRTNAALNVGGQAVRVAANMRFAANAGRFAAAAFCLNPLSIGLIGLTWLASECIDYKNGSFMLTCGPGGAQEGPPPPPGWFNLQTGAHDQSSADAACKSYSPTSHAGTIYEHSSYYSAACLRDSDGVEIGQTSQSKPEPAPPPKPFEPVPISNAEIIAKMEHTPIPDDLPAEIPTVPLPVEKPVLNPGPDALPAPLFVPTGNPVATPNPEVFNQPGIIVIPAPLPSDFWRVDIKPVNIPQDSPVPKTQLELNPATPSTAASAPVPVSADHIGLCDQYPGIAACAPAATQEDKNKFCDENPDVLGCKKIDVPDVPEMKAESKDISITPDSGWGESGGHCPAPRKLSKSEISFQPYCDFASGVRPVVIAVAWLTAAGMLLGLGKGGE